MLGHPSLLRSTEGIEMRALSRTRQNVWELTERTDDRNSFQRAVCPMLVVGQCFAIMPVDGITSRKGSDLRFSWLSIRVLYTFFSLCGTFALFYLQTWDLMSLPSITYSACAGCIFFSITFVSVTMFLRLATKWPDLVSKWEELEKDMLPSCGYPKNLAFKCRMTSAVLLTLSTAEHLGAIISEIIRALPCAKGGILDIFRTFYMVWFGTVFRHTKYALWKALILQFSNFLNTFTWSYMDVFVSVISIALVAKFNQINERLERMRGKEAPWWQWREIREHYDKLCSLTQTVDDHISHLILLCIFSDLYFVCLQLFNSLQNVKSLYGYIFFSYSFGYLLVRAITMCLSAAAVNEASKIPKHALFSVPSKSYNEEVDRFIDQVTTGEVALTGFRFIQINRRFLLTVIGSIATYELLLVQQNIGGNPHPELSVNATNTSFGGCPVFD